MPASRISKFGKAEQKYLLGLARNAIKGRLEHKALEFVKPEFKSLEENRGVFVTLTINGGLRGCIGNIEAMYPVYEAVVRNAVNAGFHDFRFGPLMDDEFDKIKIEISILTVPKKLDYRGSEDLLKKLNKKLGVILNDFGFSSVFLPQVWDEIPDKVDFMEHLSMKAGLSPNAWKDVGAVIEVFEVQAFSE